jgi:glucosamine 6-phosphate synthetase-like amidotransferase/phosphosugar isomerase protein
MCGIIGIIGNAPVTPLLVEALKRLEYRGYDSAGVATLINGHIDRWLGAMLSCSVVLLMSVGKSAVPE